MGSDREWPAWTLLGGLPISARDALLSLGTERRFEAQEILLTAGDSTTHIVLVLEGWVKVIAESKSGEVALLDIRTGGDLVGEQAGLDEQPRSAWVRAATPTTARTIEMSDFLRFLRSEKSDEKVLRTVLSVLSGKLRSATRRRVAFIGQDTKPRLALVIDELVETYGMSTADGIQIPLPLRYGELASLVDAGERSVQREMPELQRDGIIKSDSGWITVLDRRRLQVLAGLLDEDV
jgi:CRP/FNR family cyclic AMP-dependent transcriptional regulator